MQESKSTKPREDIEIEDYVFDDDWDTAVMKLGPLYVQFETGSISPSGSGGDKPAVGGDSNIHIHIDDNIDINDNSNNITTASTHLDFIKANEILLTIEFVMKKYMTFHYGTMFKTLQILSLEEVSSAPSSKSMAQVSTTVTIKVRGMKLFFSEFVPDKIAVVNMLQKAIIAMTTDNHNDTIIQIASIDLRGIRLQWGEKRYEYATSTALDSFDKSSSASLPPAESPVPIHYHGGNIDKSGFDFDRLPNASDHTNVMNGTSFSALMYGIFAASLLASISLFFILQRQLRRNQQLQNMNDNNIRRLHHFLSNSTPARTNTAFREVAVRHNQMISFGVERGISEFPLRLLDLEHTDLESSHDHNTTCIDIEKCSLV